MNTRQRVIAIAVAGTLLLGGFAFGRLAEPSKSTAEESKAEVKPVVGQPQNLSPEAAKENQAFFLSDFKTGYNDGYNAGVVGDTANAASTNRDGYNDGYKQGFAEGYKVRMNPQSTQVVSAAPVTRVVAPAAVARPVVVRSAPAPKRSSTLKKVLTIAAPAAIGAGIGGAVGGGKGAGVGALLGGGGGALYTIIKDRNNR
ncbi:MAG TPA: hypothetical protein VJ302_17920 [Blastocatellia bacterium]|nr:hypothetical protein [Blastocatellia bacterium]